MKFFSTLFAVVATAATALAQMSIDSPAAIVQCQPVALNWRGGTAPYFLSIIPGGQVSAAALIDFGQFTTTSYTWTANITAGTSITLKLTDSTGSTVYSSPITILASSNSACIGGAAASAQSSIASSASSAATTTVGSTTASSAAPSTSAAGAATSSASSAATSASSQASSAASSASNAASSAAGGATSAVSSRVASASSAASSAVAGASSAVSSAAAAATSPASAGHVNGVKLGAVALAIVGGAAAML